MILRMVSYDRPVAAIVLTIIGGFFILIGGSFVFFLALAFNATNPLSYLNVPGLSIGVIVLILGTLLAIIPRQHILLGILIIIFSISSIFGALGGFLIGLILGIIGGVLGIIYKPFDMRMNYAQQWPVQQPGGTQAVYSDSTIAADHTSTGPISSPMDTVLYRIRGVQKEIYLTEFGVAVVRLRSRAGAVALSNLPGGSWINDSLDNKSFTSATNQTLADFRRQGKIVKEFPWGGSQARYNWRTEENENNRLRRNS